MINKVLFSVIFILAVLPFAFAVDVTDCGVINQSGTYNLVNDVYSNGTCFTITADDVKFNGFGNGVYYNLAGGPLSHGFVADGVENFELKYAMIEDLSSNGAGNSGISLSNVDGALIELNFIKTNGTLSNQGIIAWSSNQIFLNRNFIHAYGSMHRNYGIQANFLTESAIYDNEVNTFGTYENFGIMALNSGDIKIGYNDVSADGTVGNNYGIYLGSGGELMDNQVSSPDLDLFIISQDVLLTDQLISGLSYSINALSLEVRDTNYGYVDFIGHVSDSGSDLASVIEFNQGRLFVDSSTGFNLPAMIELTDLGFFPDKDIRMDSNDDGNFTICPTSQCTFYSRDQNSISFGVSGFTTYKAVPSIRRSPFENVLSSQMPNPQNDCAHLNIQTRDIPERFLNNLDLGGNAGALDSNCLEAVDIGP